MERSCWKCAPKASPRPLFNFALLSKAAIACKKLLKIRYFERGLSKSLKENSLGFLSNLVPFNGQSYQKQKGSGTNDQLLFRLPNKFRNIPLFVIYYLTKFDGVM